MALTIILIQQLIKPSSQMFKSFSSRSASGHLTTINSPSIDQSVSGSSTSPLNVAQHSLPTDHMPINQLTSTQILHSSLESLYGKLEELRRALAMCAQIEQIAAIAAAMRECATAIHAIQSTFTA
jgi:hypothetical protein